MFYSIRLGYCIAGLNDDLTGLNKDLVAVSDIQEKGIDKNQEILDEIDQFPTGRLYMYITVMSPNIARPLTLRTSPRDYATFNQIKSFFDI